MPTVEQSLIKLPLRKKELLNDLAEKHRLMNVTHDEYCEMIDRCQRNGISFGQMAFALGTPQKERIWRSWRRWLARKAK